MYIRKKCQQSSLPWTELVQKNLAWASTCGKILNLIQIYSKISEKIDIKLILFLIQLRSWLKVKVIEIDI